VQRRVRPADQLLRQVLTEDLGIIPLHFNPGVIAYTAGLTGLNVKTPDSDVSWNIYEWVLH
jgi:hypothetical protein